MQSPLSTQPFFPEPSNGAQLKANAPPMMYPALRSGQPLTARRALGQRSMGVIVGGHEGGHQTSSAGLWRIHPAQRPFTRTVPGTASITQTAASLATGSSLQFGSSPSGRLLQMASQFLR